MSGNPLLKRLLDAGMQFTEMSQEQAEKLVKEFVKTGQARRKDSEQMVQQLVDRGRSATEQIVSTVQAELSKQLGTSPGDAAGQLAQALPSLIDHLTPHGSAPEGGLGDAGDLFGMLGGLLQKS